MIERKNHKSPAPIRSIRELPNYEEIKERSSTPTSPDIGESEPRPGPQPEPIPLRKKVVHLAEAGVRVIKAAANSEPVRVSDQERSHRLAICRDCEYWSEGGNRGLGECRHEKCGCTRFKHGLATERCPLDKW